MFEKSIRKTVFWEYENEYRFVLAPYTSIESVAEGFNHKIEYDPNCPPHFDVPIFKNIEEVVIGPKMTEDDEKQITDFLLENGIDQIRRSKVNYY